MTAIVLSFELLLFISSENFEIVGLFISCHIVNISKESHREEITANSFNLDKHMWHTQP